MTLYVASLTLEIEYLDMPGLVVVPDLRRIIGASDPKAAEAQLIADEIAIFDRRVAQQVCPPYATLTVTVRDIAEAKRA